MRKQSTIFASSQAKVYIWSKRKTRGLSVHHRPARPRHHTSKSVVRMRAWACFGVLFSLLLKPTAEAACPCEAFLNKVFVGRDYAVGFTDSKGKVNLWWSIGDVVLGGTRVPLAMNFSSSRGEGMFGHGWEFPFLESKAFFARDKELYARLPGGRVVTLVGEKELRSMDGYWSASYEGEEIKLNYRDGGVLVYRGGKLVEVVMQTDKGSLSLHWSYTNGIPTSVQTAAGVPLIEAKLSGGFVDALTFRDSQSNGRKIQFTFGAFPNATLVNGLPLLLNLTRSIQKIEGGKAGTEVFQYEFSPEGTIKLLSTDFRGKLLNLTYSVGSGDLLSDGEYTYERKIPSGISDPVVVRTSKAGTSEWMHSNSQSGVVIHQNLDGTKEEVCFFPYSGMMAGKARWTRLYGSDGTRKTETKYHYDEVGRLLRSVGNDVTSAYEYHPNGKTSKVTYQFPASAREEQEFYSPEGTLLKNVTNGVETLFDASGKVTGVFRDGKPVWEITVDANGNRVFRKASEQFQLTVKDKATP